MNNLRPEVAPENAQWSPSYVSLMQDCWDSDQHKRPRFDLIIERLQQLQRSFH
jgi:hypothetical protein